MRFNKCHALTIKFFNRFVNDRLVFKLVCKIKGIAPVAEVARNHENCLLIHKKRQKQLRIAMILVVVNISNHQRHKFQVARPACVLENFLDVRDMHFETVLIFFGFFANLYDLEATWRILRVLD